MKKISAAKSVRASRDHRVITLTHTYQNTDRGAGCVCVCVCEGGEDSAETVTTTHKLKPIGDD